MGHLSHCGHGDQNRTMRLGWEKIVGEVVRKSMGILNLNPDRSTDGFIMDFNGSPSAYWGGKFDCSGLKSK